MRPGMVEKYQLYETNIHEHRSGPKQSSIEPTINWALVDLVNKLGG